MEENETPGMLVTLGDCEIYGECAHCGKSFGCVKPDKSLDVLGLTWERHIMRDGCVS